MSNPGSGIESSFSCTTELGAFPIDTKLKLGKRYKEVRGGLLDTVVILTFPRKSGIQSLKPKLV